jgi:hypothetical protein
MVDKPKFNSQSKHRLDSPQVKTEIKKSDITKLLKWKFITKLEDNFKLKDLAFERFKKLWPAKFKIPIQT